MPELYHLPGFYEPFSAMSHLLGAGVFLVLGVLLLRRGRGDAMRLWFLGIYVFSCLLLLSLSGVFHMMARGTTARSVLERLDHGAIFVLIAGTFTPAHGLLFRGWLRRGPLLLIWTVAITGITLKSIYLSDLPEGLGLATYLTMGWIGLASAILLARRYGFKFIKPLLVGGVAYSLGAIVEFLGWRVVVPGVIHPHEILHLAVLIGAFFHYLFVWQFATGTVVESGRQPRLVRELTTLGGFALAGAAAEKIGPPAGAKPPSVGDDAAGAGEQAEDQGDLDGRISR